jgi:glycerol kinase
MKYILTIDQGTTASRSVLVDENGIVVAQEQREFKQHFPRQGWVEHDPNEIWETQHATIVEVLRKSGVSPQQLAGIGITNQRETTLAWHRESGEPIGAAIVWQDKRTASLCEELKAIGLESHVKSTTGLVIDAYFSGTKMQWMLQHYPQAAKLQSKGLLCFGTVDSWLIWKLSKGRLHVTDVTNASRTLLFDINALRWDDTLLAALGVHRNALPEVKPTIGYFGDAEIAGHSIPILGCAGDQQAALFGQQCFAPGMIKNTYGTGCFMLMHTGKEPHYSQHGLLTTLAWSDEDGPEYALEGSVFIAGAAVQWLRDGLKLIDRAPDSEYFAQRADFHEPVYVVPAFAGLGAPYWDMYARGAIFGLTRDSGKDELIRATLESMAYQTRDVLEAMATDANLPFRSLRVDGGASANNFLMQFQADLLQCEVVRPDNVESTALGAAYMAGLAAKMWTKQQLSELCTPNRVFQPRMDAKQAQKLYHGWQKAVKRSMHWLDDEPK